MSPSETKAPKIKDLATKKQPQLNRRKQKKREEKRQYQIET